MSQETDKPREKAMWLETRAHETHFPNLKWDFETAASLLRQAAGLLELAQRDTERLDWLEDCMDRDFCRDFFQEPGACVRSFVDFKMREEAM